MDFRRTMEILKTFGYSDDIYTLFDHNDAEVFRESVNFMEDFVSRAINSTDLSPLLERDDQFEKVEITLSNFLRKFILTNFNEMTTCVLDAYITLAQNFADASENKRPSIAEYVASLIALMNYQHSIVDAIYILRELSNEARGFMRFKPPAFEISEHYLQSIKERINGSR